MNIKPSKQKWLPLEYQGDVFLSGYEIEHSVEENDLINRTAVVRDPYARWCGRGEPRGFSLSRLAMCIYFRQDPIASN
jgi:hypothetical protein